MALRVTQISIPRPPLIPIWAAWSRGLESDDRCCWAPGETAGVLCWRATEMSYVSPRFACRIVNDVVLGVHTEENPSDADWQSYIDATRTVLERHGSARILAYSLGGGPNPLQRKEANELLKDRPQRVAVMLDSALVRGVVTALSWFNPKIRSFNLHQLDAAAEYLELGEKTTIQVRAAMQELLAAIQSAKGG